MAPFLAWLQANGVPGYLGELGVPADDPQWLPVLSGALAALQAAGVPSTVWFVAYDDPPGSHPWWAAKAQAGAGLGLGSTPAGAEAPQWGVLRPLLGGVGSALSAHRGVA